MRRAIPLRYGDFIGFVGTRNEKERRREWVGGQEAERRKSGIGLIANVCSSQWVYLDFASVRAFDSRHEARSRRNRITRSLGHLDTRGPRMELRAYACRTTHISLRAPASFVAARIEGF